MAASGPTFIGGDADDVVGVLLDQVCIEVIEGVAHVLGMLLIDAEDNGFIESAVGLQKIGEVTRNCFGTRQERDFALKILGGVFGIWNLAAQAVSLASVWPPAHGVRAGDDAMDTVGREETIVDALPQAIRVERIAEVDVGIAVIFALGGGGHAKLVGGLEIFEDL